MVQLPIEFNWHPWANISNIYAGESSRDRVPRCDPIVEVVEDFQYSSHDFRAQIIAPTEYTTRDTFDISQFVQTFLLQACTYLTLERRTFWTTFNDGSGHFDRCEINCVIMMFYYINRNDINSQLVKYDGSFTELCLYQVLCYYVSAFLNSLTPRGWVPPLWRFSPVTFLMSTIAKVASSHLLLRMGDTYWHMLHHLDAVTWHSHMTYVMTSNVHDGGKNTVLPLFGNRDNYWSRCDKLLRLVSFPTKLRS